MLHYARRLNVRLIVFLSILVIPVLWFEYRLLNPVDAGGVQQHVGWARVDLKALGNFPFDPYSGGIEQVPARFRQLDGKRVVLEGFMAYPSVGDNFRDFQFVYNLRRGSTKAPQVQERVFVHCPSDRKVAYINDFARLTGILHVKIIRDPNTGQVVALYEMDMEHVEPIGTRY
ncbi:MAG TPA: hypothetical protein VFC78_16965 [Tepidisphaeraceae bacterium]|nr:hypothetical protein [Tepidisphaeraceae bacterium]